MARLIDVDEAKAEIIAFSTGCNSTILPLDAILMILNQIETVDAVEVTHCKNCKHWMKDVPVCTDTIGRCRFANYMVGGNAYCVYGERKDGDGNG